MKDDTRWKGGFVEVEFKPVSEKEDQAGGFIWRQGALQLRSPLQIFLAWPWEFDIILQFPSDQAQNGK
jgi:hypothetical protein